jgi:hypothetical protein
MGGPKPLWRMSDEEIASVRQDLERRLEGMLTPYQRRNIGQQIKDLMNEQELRLQQQQADALSVM